MSNYSTHPTLVEYAIRSLFKGQSPRKAASTTAQKHHGSTNLFMGGTDLIEINVFELEEAIWKRLVDTTLVAISHIKPGKEHFALDGILQRYNQKPSLRKKLKIKVIDTIGSNPFTSDDKD